MTKLTDTQLVILSAAAARDDRAVLPPPDSLTLNKASLTTVLNSLLKKGLIAEQPMTPGATQWREADNQRLTLVATTAGLEAIGVETPDGETSPASEPIPEQRKIGRTSGKADAVLSLLRRPEGASIADMNAVTDWQAHSIRAFLSGLRKNGTEVARGKDDGGKAVYRIVDTQEAAP